MEKDLNTQAERFLLTRHKDKYRIWLLRVLAVVVAFATIYVLIFPAITMSNEVECGMVEHVHTEDCWQEQLTPPQPQLICPFQGSDTVVLHTHDSFCYNQQGELICTLEERTAHTHGAECYREHRELICTETPDPGHTHTAACYAQERGGELICGLEESGQGHTHTRECYPLERMDEPQCGLEESEDVVDEATGEVTAPGHHHSAECWEKRVERKLVCGQEESEDVVDESTGEVLVPGHHHSAECWLTGDELCYQYGCGQHESRGHTHSDSCYDWTPRLICQEEERPAGHVHTDECYEITQLFVCLEPEIVPHTHDAGCYDENGALVCQLPEVAAHQHTAECFTTPEGEAEPVRTLICGMEEHQHDERCYVQVEEKEGPTFYCGLEEHVHTMPDCYFETGNLRCTFTEHVHDLTCLEPPAESSEDPEASESPEVSESMAPEASQSPEVPSAEGVELVNAQFPDVYSSPEFTLSFQISGFAKVAGQEQDQAPAQPAQDPQPSPSGEMFMELVENMVPLAAMPRMMSYAFPADNDLDSAAPPTIDDIFNSANAPGSEPEPDEAAVGDSGQDALDNPFEPAGEPAFTPEATPAPEVTPSLPEAGGDGDQQSRVEIQVEELEEEDPRLESILDEIRKTQDMDSTILLKGLAVSVTVDGKPADTSACKIMARIQPTRTLIEAVNQDGSGLMAASEEDLEEDAADGGEEIEAETALNVFTRNGLEKIVPLTEDAEAGAPEQAEASLMTLSDDGIMMMSLNKEVYPDFTVKYVSVLRTVQTDKNADGTPFTPLAGYTAISTIIDTSGAGDGTGGTLPVNGTGTASPTGKLRTMYIKEGTGEVLMRSETQEIYLPRKFNYSTANKMGHINIVSQGNNSHYTLATITVKYKDGTTVEKKKYTPDLQLTNRKQTADENPNFLYVENDCEIELTYDTVTGSQNYNTVFYDYDITTGRKYTQTGSAWDYTKYSGWDPANTENKTWYVNTQAAGINSTANCSADIKYAFGNVNTGTKYGENRWSRDNKDNKLNAYNRVGADGLAIGYQGCTFGLVGSRNGKDNVNFNVSAPKVFGNETQEGKSIYANMYDLSFKRNGDTYTLSSVTGTGATGLESFNHPSPYEGKVHTHIWTNDFWPMDSAPSYGTDGHDMKFGSYSKRNQRQYVADSSTGKNLPYSDDGQDHNSYFGMTFQVDFDLPTDYMGPLEYYFFGDDDMWVFLDDELVCDIGGVHSAVGEYVNLWDYIERDNSEFIDCTDEKYDPEGGGNTHSTKHTLTFFYTERGASGSTCWMQWTLPNATSSSYKTPEEEVTLHLEKKVQGVDSGEAFQFNIQLTHDDPNALKDLVNVKAYRTGTDGEWKQVDETLDLTGVIAETLLDGQSYIITGLPPGTKYTITEKREDGFVPEFKVETHLGSQYGNLVGEAAVTGADVNTVSGVLGTLGPDGKYTGGTYVVAKCINRSSYELPATGGAGSMYTMAGLPLLMALSCVWYKKKSRREGAEDGV